VRITIADTGTGIETAALDRLFEAFYTTKGIGGTGLGLWIIQELIEKIGGSIRIRQFH
jgi:signal transduction histidine kinase